MELSKEEDDGNIEDIDITTWKSWTYKKLRQNYKLYMKSDDSAGILLKSRLQYHTKRTWCCGRHTRDMIYSDQKYVKRFFRDIGKLLKRILQDESYDVYIDIEESDEIKRRDVIIWSVILNKRDDVMFLLKNGLTEDANHTKGTCLYAALFASAMLKVLSKLADAEENMDLGASFMENSRF